MPKLAADLTELIAHAIEMKGRDDMHYRPGPISPTLHEKASQVGINLTGYHLRITASRIRHILRSHTDCATETVKGNVAVGHDHLRMIVSILTAPEKVDKAPGDLARPALYVKRQLEDGSVVCIVIEALHIPVEKKGKWKVLKYMDLQTLYCLAAPKQ